MSKSNEHLANLINKHIDPLVNVEFGDVLPSETETYDMVILWNYHIIIDGLNEKTNFVVFHSSNLPQGKGWAPIFNAISNNEEFFYVTAIIANEKIDSGDIIAQAKFRLKSNYTAEYIRKWDEEICIILCNKILSSFKGKDLKGIKQVGEETFYKRRYPYDNELDDSKSLKEISSFLRATEDNFPSYFYVNGEKYFIKVTPENTPIFPDDIDYVIYNN
jgi:methionyl-tRNA formyltransferase